MTLCKAERQKIGVALLQRIAASGIALSEISDESALTIGLNWVTADAETRHTIEARYPEVIAKLKRLS